MGQTIPKSNTVRQRCSCSMHCHLWVLADNGCWQERFETIARFCPWSAISQWVSECKLPSPLAHVCPNLWTCESRFMSSTTVWGMVGGTSIDDQRLMHFDVKLSQTLILISQVLPLKLERSNCYWDTEWKRLFRIWRIRDWPAQTMSQCRHLCSSYARIPYLHMCWVSRRIYSQINPSI